MVQVLPQRISFQAFFDWYPNNGQRYELQEGFIKAMTRYISRLFICHFLEY